MLRERAHFRAVLALVVTVGAASACGSGSDNTPVRAEGTTIGSSEPSPADGTPGSIPAPPLSPRVGVSVAASADHVFAFGGSSGANGKLTPHADGAVYDISEGAWRTTSQAPFSEGLFEPAAVATPDGDFIVVGLPCEQVTGDIKDLGCDAPELEAALYSPGSNAWRSLPASDVLRTNGSAEGGASALGWTAAGATFQLAVAPSPTIAAFEPTSSSWARVPPVAGVLDPYCGTSAGVVAVAGSDVGAQAGEDGETKAVDMKTHLFNGQNWRDAASEPTPLADQITSSVKCESSAVVYLPWHKDATIGPTWWFGGPNATWSEVPQLEVPVARRITVAETADGTRVLAFAVDRDLRISSLDQDSNWHQTVVEGASDAHLVNAGNGVLIVPADPLTGGLRLLDAKALAS
jgi:hypothetical protein